MREAWPKWRMLGSSFNRIHLTLLMKRREKEESLGTGIRTSKEFVKEFWRRKVKWNKVHSAWASLMAQTVKNLPAVAGDPALISRYGRSLEEGNGYPLQYSYLENSMDRGVWRATVQRVTNSQTGQESNTHTYTF